jgi:hypothetical protein
VLPQVPEQVAKPAVGTVQAVAPELPTTDADTAAPPPPSPAARKAPEAHRRAPAEATSEPRSANSKTVPLDTASHAPATAVERSATQAAQPVAEAGRATAELSSGVRPDGPSFGAGGGAASAAFSAGALAILLSSLFLAASALRTRLPHLGEAGRPLPLVFALERPG